MIVKDRENLKWGCVFIAERDECGAYKGKKVSLEEWASLTEKGLTSDSKPTKKAEEEKKSTKKVDNKSTKS